MSFSITACGVSFSITACDENDIDEAPVYCEGCLVSFKTAEADLRLHETTCVAFRDWRIEQSLEFFDRLDAQARDPFGLEIAP